MLDKITHDLVQKIQPSLFSKHKLVFSFILTATIVYGKNALQKDELKHFILTGHSESVTSPANPTSWIDDNKWSHIFKQIYGLSTLKAFEGFDEFFMTNSE